VPRNLLSHRIVQDLHQSNHQVVGLPAVQVLLQVVHLPVNHLLSLVHLQRLAPVPLQADHQAQVRQMHLLDHLVFSLRVLLAIFLQKVVTHHRAHRRLYRPQLHLQYQQVREVICHLQPHRLSHPRFRVSFLLLLLHHEKKVSSLLQFHRLFHLDLLVFSRPKIQMVATTTKVVVP
jgi:hypothetical protein